jgi:hypothetical protein
MAEVVVLRNPLDTSRRRRCRLADGVMLLDWVEREEPAGGHLMRAVYVNGHVCTDVTYRTQPGDEVLVAFAPGEIVGMAVVQALVAFVIGFFVNALFGPKQPTAADTPQASQVYGIAPPRNAVRLGQPIPAIYGSVICLPDFAAQPYTFFFGNEQYLHAILCVGLGEFDVTEMLFGQTSAGPAATPTIPASVVQWTVFLPATHGSTFGVIEGNRGVRENVVSSSAVGNQELVALNAGGALVPSTWYWAFGSTFGSEYPLGVHLYNYGSPAAKLSALPQNPALGVTALATVAIIYQPSGLPNRYTCGTYTATAYVPSQKTGYYDLVPPPGYSQSGQVKWIGPFATCKPGQRGSLIELDFVFPNGLYVGDSSGNLQNCTVQITTEAQAIDDKGVDIPGAPLTFVDTFVAKDNTPQRQTVKHDVPSGRYRVRAQRTSNSDLKATTADHVIWAGLKFQLDPPPAGTRVYGDVTLIAVVLKATNGIASDAASSMRFRVTRRLRPLADASAATAPTVNPADAFADILCAPYGGARPSTADKIGDELDIPELTMSRNAWAAHDGFNAVFDQPSTVWEALGLSVQTVHAAPLPVGSRMSLIHDQVQPVRAQLFTDANIVAGSLKVNQTFDRVGTPEGVRVNWRDPTTFGVVALLVPPDAPDFSTIDLFGCTSGTVAQEHANLAAAKRQKQRASIEFECELEGLNVLPGDRIGVAAGMVKWAQGARVESVDGLVLTLSTPLIWTSGAVHAVQLRDPAGAPVRMVGVTRGDADNVVVLPSVPSFTVTGANANQEATSLSFGVQDQEITDWTVTKVTPSGSTVTLECLTYDPSIYAGAAAFTRGAITLDEEA